MAKVTFTDNSAIVKAALDDVAIAYLYEAGGELEAQVKRNSRVGSGQLKNSWMYKVDEGKGVCTVGSPLENAIWEEFGTGEFASHGDGRKGGWWIPVGNGGISPSDANKYSWEKVRRDENGNITFVFTRGKTPHRAFQRAFDSLKSALIQMAKDMLGDRMK